MTLEEAVSASKQGEATIITADGQLLSATIVDGIVISNVRLTLPDGSVHVTAASDKEISIYRASDKWEPHGETK
jgi:hypothetical protein